MAKRNKTPEVPVEVVHPATSDTPEKPVEHSDLLVAKARNRSGDNIFKRFGHWYKSHKKLSIPLTVLALLAIVLGVPFTRYKVLGLAIHKNYSVTVLDSVSGKPVSQADIKLAGKTAKTDEKGQATISQAPLGNQTASVSKKYYKDTSAKVLVSLTNSKNKADIKLEATGRQVPVTVTNKITGKGIQGATITVQDTEAKTDEKGEATVVVPAGQTSQKATITLDGYHELAADMEVTEQPSDKNKFAIAPSGKLYFLSKQSGKIDVVKTNLDGSERQVVLAGTGKEQESDTILLAARDWKFLALKSRREGDKAKLYLIDTSNDSLTTMDEGDATFDITGWSNHDFIYKVSRNKQPWEAKAKAIKSYNADSKKLATMQESQAQGTSVSDFLYEDFTAPYIVDDRVLYATTWQGDGYADNFTGKQREIFTAKPGTSERQVLKSFPVSSTTSYAGIEAKPYAPNEIYYAIFENQKWEFYEYEDGQVKPATTDEETFFNKVYPRYIQSPSGNTLFWAEARDGKNTLLLGDKKAENGQELGALSELTPYGWYTENYLLVSKKDSELYIMNKAKDATPLKVSDYHKPAFNNNGYGGGY
jgi:hypothetical protein